MKSQIRSLAAETLQLTRITALARRSNRSALVVLCYHRVLPSRERDAYVIPALAVTPEMFDAQIAIAARNYRCLPLREAMPEWQNETHKKPLLAITFDDGYADNAIHAAPILEKHGVRATFFVVSGLIGSRERTWYDLLGRMVQRMAQEPIAELARKPDEDDPVAVWIAEHFRHRHGLNTSRIIAAAKTLPHALRCAVLTRLRTVAPAELLRDTSDQIMALEAIQRLASQRHEIASHSVMHPLLPQLSDTELQHELAESRSALGRMTGMDVGSFAYPNGDHDGRVVDAARTAGYTQAVTMQPGINHRGSDPMYLRRIYVTTERFRRGDGQCNASLFELELSGLADRIFFRRHRSPVTT